MRFYIGVAGEILCGPTDLEQQLLDPAAFAGWTTVVSSSMRAPSIGAIFLLRKRINTADQAHQRQAIGGDDQLQSSVAGHGVDVSTSRVAPAPRSLR